MFARKGLKKKYLGEVAEWSKAHAWKVCKRQKRFQGSNPCLSARNAANQSGS